MTIFSDLNRPRRHRIYGVATRVSAVVVALPIAYQQSAVVGLAVLTGGLLIAAIHDLVAATLRPKFHIIADKSFKAALGK